MIQQLGIQLKCQKEDHLDEIETVCYNQFCTEFRINCFKCIKKGIHHAHLDDVEKINSMLEFIQNKNKECDNLIYDLNTQVESVNQSFSQLKRGIRNKFSLLQERLVHLNLQQINDFLNSIVKLTEYKQSITTIISEQIKKLTHSFNDLYGQLKLSQINYYQNDDNDRKLSKEFYDYGYQLYRDDKYNQAIEILDKSIQSDPNNQLSLQCKGSCLKMLDKYDDAIIWLDKALTIDPKNIKSLSEKGQCLKLLNKYEETITWLDNTLAIDPKHVISLWNKGQCLKMLDKYEDAIVWLDRALNIDSKHVYSLSEKGSCLKMLDQYEDAIIWLDKALAIDSKHIYSLSEKGSCLRLLNKCIDAIFWLDQALSLDPKHANSLSNKGDCLRQFKKYKESLNLLDQALSINQQDTFSLQCKGILSSEFQGHCLQDQQKYTEALIYFEKSLKIQPNHQWTKNQKDFCNNKLKK